MQNSLKGGYKLLRKCKSFTDAFIIQTCGNNRQLDYATPRSTKCMHVQRCLSRKASIQPSFL